MKEIIEKIKYQFSNQYLSPMVNKFDVLNFLDIHIPNAIKLNNEELVEEIESLNMDHFLYPSDEFRETVIKIIKSKSDE